MGLFTCSLTASYNLPHIHNTMKVLIALSCLLAVALASPSPKNAFTCDLCVDIITDIDEFLTSDTTEQQIVDFVKDICHALGQLIAGFEATCNFLIESQLPAIIDGLVADNLNPTQVCTDIMAACP